MGGVGFNAVFFAQIGDHVPDEAGAIKKSGGAGQFAEPGGEALGGDAVGRKFIAGLDIEGDVQ